MQKNKLIIILALALLCGLVASMGIFFYLRDKEALLKERFHIKPATQEVVVASRSISWGETITESHLKISNWPKEEAPKKSFTSPNELIGRMTKREVVEGEPILADLLLPKEGILSTIPPGKRAMSVEIDHVISVHGFIQPGSYVDVVATAKSSKNESVSKVILQNVQVLAIGQKVEMEETNKKSAPEKITVTMALDPKEVEKLALALNEGKIHLVLRNFSERTIVTTEGITPDNLLGRIELGAAISENGKNNMPQATDTVVPVTNPSPALPPAPAEEKKPPIRYQVVEVIKGVERHQERFLNKTLAAGELQGNEQTEAMTTQVPENMNQPMAKQEILKAEVKSE